MRSERLARALLRLYPRAWRSRYGEEFLSLLADAGLTWRGVADVARAALSERVLQPGSLSRAGMTWHRALTEARERRGLDEASGGAWTRVPVLTRGPGEPATWPAKSQRRKSPRAQKSS